MVIDTEEKKEDIAKAIWLLGVRKVLWRKVLRSLLRKEHST